MYANERPLPEALVLRWDSKTLQVRCPFCLGSHRYWHARHTEHLDLCEGGWQRQGYCADESYTLVFPGTDGTIGADYGWEVNGENREFVTVTADGPVTVPIVDNTDGRTLLPQFRKLHVISIDDDTDGLIAATENLDIREAVDEQNSEPKPRKTGNVDKVGNTGILFAAYEENGLPTLRWLQDQGGSIIQANHYGRTPLMEATLWGLLGTVQYLTRHLTSNDLEKLDGNGMRAVDLAAYTPRNENERIHRCGEDYREPPYANRHRVQIKALLERLTSSGPRRLNSTTELRRIAFFSRKPNGNLEICRPQVLLNVPCGPDGPQKQKTFATLDRGPNYPYVNAMSGYSHGGWPDVLPNNLWTDKANRLREYLGLRSDIILASHVEAQLLAYLLDRHSLVMFEDKRLQEELGSVKPTCKLWPIITVSKPNLCAGCLEFFRLFEEKLGGLGLVNVVFKCEPELK